MRLFYQSSTRPVQGWCVIQTKPQVFWQIFTAARTVFWITFTLNSSQSRFAHICVSPVYARSGISESERNLLRYSMATYPSTIALSLMLGLRSFEDRLILNRTTRPYHQRFLKPLWANIFMLRICGRLIMSSCFMDHAEPALNRLESVLMRYLVKAKLPGSTC